MIRLKTTQLESFSKLKTTNPPSNKIQSTNNKNTWYVYILECQDGSFYTGVTNNIDKRMKTHAEGRGSKYVRQKKFKKLLRSKECKNRSEAQKSECHIKTLPKYTKLDWFNQ